MTDDIVRRLLESDGMEVFTAGDGHKAIRADTTLMREAADEIERLRSDLSFWERNTQAEIERLRQANAEWLDKWERMVRELCYFSVLPPPAV
jgi:hypothetical protein